MAEYKFLLTAKKILITSGIYGIPAFIAWATENNIEWAIAFSVVLHAVVDWLKHRQ